MEKDRVDESPGAAACALPLALTRPPSDGASPPVWHNWHLIQLAAQLERAPAGPSRALRNALTGHTALLQTAGALGDDWTDGVFGQQLELVLLLIHDFFAHATPLAAAAAPLERVQEGTPMSAAVFDHAAPLRASHEWQPVLEHVRAAIRDGLAVDPSRRTRLAVAATLNPRSRAELPYALGHMRLVFKVRRHCDCYGAMVIRSLRASRLVFMLMALGPAFDVHSVLDYIETTRSADGTRIGTLLIANMELAMMAAHADHNGFLVKDVHEPSARLLSRRAGYLELRRTAESAPLIYPRRIGVADSPADLDMLWLTPAVRVACACAFLATPMSAMSAFRDRTPTHDNDTDTVAHATGFAAAVGPTLDRAHFAALRAALGALQTALARTLFPAPLKAVLDDAKGTLAVRGPDRTELTVAYHYMLVYDPGTAEEEEEERRWFGSGNRDILENAPRRPFRLELHQLDIVGDDAASLGLNRAILKRLMLHFFADMAALLCRPFVVSRDVAEPSMATGREYVKRVRDLPDGLFVPALEAAIAWDAPDARGMCQWSLRPWERQNFTVGSSGPATYRTLFTPTAGKSDFVTIVSSQPPDDASPLESALSATLVDDDATALLHTHALALRRAQPGGLTSAARLAAAVSTGTSNQSDWPSDQAVRDASEQEDARDHRPAEAMAQPSQDTYEREAEQYAAQRRQLRRMRELLGLGVPASPAIHLHLSEDDNEFGEVESGSDSDEAHADIRASSDDDADVRAHWPWDTDVERAAAAAGPVPVDASPRWLARAAATEDSESVSVASSDEEELESPVRAPPTTAASVDEEDEILEPIAKRARYRALLQRRLLI